MSVFFALYVTNVFTNQVTWCSKAKIPSLAGIETVIVFIVYIQQPALRSPAVAG